MKKEELKNALHKANVPSDLYNLNGGLPNEALTLNEHEGCWEVYYSERGEKTQLKKFSTEDEACNYFYRTVLEILN